MPVVRGHLSEEDALEDEVANLPAQVTEVAALDGIDHFVRFLEHEWRQRRECLFVIPRAAVWRAEQPHDLDEPRELVRRLSRHAGRAVPGEAPLARGRRSSSPAYASIQP